jgi:hypothetical protein
MTTTSPNFAIGATGSAGITIAAKTPAAALIQKTSHQKTGFDARTAEDMDMSVEKGLSPAAREAQGTTADPLHADGESQTYMSRRDHDFYPTPAWATR